MCRALICECKFEVAQIAALVTGLATTFELHKGKGIVSHSIRLNLWAPFFFLVFHVLFVLSLA